MKSLYRIFLLMVICWVGYRAFRQTLEAQAAHFMLLRYGYFILLAVLTIAVIIIDVAAYRIHRRYYQFYPAFIALFFCILVGFRLYTLHAAEALKTVFTAQPFYHNNSKWIFKEKGYIVIQDYNNPVDVMYYGRYYTIKDSVFITQINYDRYVPVLPLSGIRKDDLLIWNNADTMKIQSHE